MFDAFEVVLLLVTVPLGAFLLVLLGWWILVGRKAMAELHPRLGKEETQYLARLFQDPRITHASHRDLQRSGAVLAEWTSALVPRRKRFHPNCPTVWIALPAMTFDQPGVGRA